MRRALERTAALPDGKLRLRLVRMVYWDRKYTLYAAARVLHISTRTAQRWNSKLVRLTAFNRGLIDSADGKLASPEQKTVVS